MSVFLHLATIGLSELHDRQRQALVHGAGLVIGLEDERRGAPDELVAAALPPLSRLRGLAVLVDTAEESSAPVAEAAARTAAGVLRLLDGALTVHGADHGYATDAWRERANALAHEAIHEAGEAAWSPGWFGRLVDESVDAVADATVALHRDHGGVPEALSDAIGLLLVVYVAASPDAPRD